MALSDGIQTHITYKSGVEYDGEVTDGRQDGFGKMTFTNGDTAEGFFKAGAYHGVTLYTFASGERRLLLFDMNREVERLTVSESFAANIEKYRDVDVATFKLQTVVTDGIAVQPPYTTSGSATKEKQRIEFESGSVYEGEVSDGKMNGKGKYTSVDGSVYEGDFVDNFYTGYGKIVYENGDVYIGEWKDDKKHGHGRYIWTDGKVYDGEWLDGERSGKARYSSPSGACYDGDFVNGKFEGYGDLRFPDGSHYIGEWKNGLWHGRGKHIMGDGEYYEGEYANDQRCGQGTYHTKQGHDYICTWKDDLENGHGKVIYANGEIYDGEFRDGKRNGFGNYTWPNGDRCRGIWRNGKRHGLFHYDYPNNGYTDLLFKNDSPTGCLGNMFKDGVRYIGLWDENRNVTYTQVRQNMTSPTRTKYKDGSVYYGDKCGYGEFKTPDGTIYIGRFNAGRIEWGAVYDHSGDLVMFGNFENGQLHGEGMLMMPRGESLYEGGFDHKAYHGEGVYYNAVSGYTVHARWEHGHCAEMIGAWDANGDPATEEVKYLLQMDSSYMSLA